MIKSKYIRGAIPDTATAYKSLLSIALPSVIELVLMSLIGMVDTMMVSKLGKEAIAAVGLTGQPRMLVLAVFFALNVGLTAIVARRKGEEKQKEAILTLKNTLLIVFLISIAVTAFALIYSEKLMLLAGAKEDTVEYATQYFRILIAAVPLNVILLSINAAQRGIGSTKIVMYVNITANLVNVFLNFLLINGNWGFPALGVKGAAIASVMGILVGTLLSVISIYKKDNYLCLRLCPTSKLDKNVVYALFKVGGNAALEQMALRIGFFIFARIVADLGTLDFATHQICLQFLNITFTLGDGLGVAGTSLVGQNMGRGRPDVSMIYGKVAQRVALLTSCVLIAVIIIFRQPLLYLFTDDAAIVEKGMTLMLIVALFQPLQTSAVVISGCLRGSGDTRYVAVVMIICIAIIRPLGSYISVNLFNLGLYGAWLAMMVDMVIRLVCVYMRFANFKWATIKV